MAIQTPSLFEDRAFSLKYDEDRKAIKPWTQSTPDWGTDPMLILMAKQESAAIDDDDCEFTVN